MYKHMIYVVIVIDVFKIKNITYYYDNLTYLSTFKRIFILLINNLENY